MPISGTPPSLASGAMPITPLPFCAAPIMPATLVPCATFLGVSSGLGSFCPVRKFHDMS